MKSYIDKDPIIALLKMQSGEFRNEIHAVGACPFFCHYWLSHAVDVCKEIKKRAKNGGEHLKYSGDASGGQNPTIERVDGSRSHALMTYGLTVKYQGKIIPVYHSVSERHRTIDIVHGFNSFLYNGAPIPDEAVCDESLALLNAYAIGFAHCESIYEYSDKLFKAKMKQGPLPKLWIRIDGAHYIGKWKRRLAQFKFSQRDRTFLMAMIGALVTATSLQEAEEILTGILIICTSKYDGYLTNGEPSLCRREKIKMEKRLTNKLGKFFVIKCNHFLHLLRLLIHVYHLLLRTCFRCFNNFWT